MNAFNTAAAYKNQQIMTASPEELTLMLYNGAIRFVGESLASIDAGDLMRAHNAVIRAQNIVREFMATLDMQYEISKNLYSLYDYIEFRLVQGNIKKDPVQLQEARDMLTELRDTWQTAMRQARIERQQKVAR